MYSALDDAALPAPGFPIRRSTGQRLFSALPWLIAAVHVLLRLLVPRHPPCALNILTVSCSQTRVSESSASFLYAPPPMSRGKRKERPSRNGWRTHKTGCSFRSTLACHPLVTGARPSAVFKVHGGVRTGV